MKKSDFSPQASGKVIQTLKGYLAFIPYPLPPNTSWSNKLMTALSKADRGLARLAELGNNFPAPHIVRPFIRKEAVLSSQIEGTHTTFRELLGFEAGQISLFHDPEDIREVHNYVRAVNYGLERLQTLPISIRLLREIHAVLMEGVRGGILTPGEVRRSQNWIGRPGAIIENARFVPPPVDEMVNCLSEMERFIHMDSELPPLLRIGMIHYQFEVIHPFLDGNGRLGRLLITFLLVYWNLLPKPLLNLSDFLETNRQEYYDRLLDVSQKGAWEAWLLFFLEGVHHQTDDACLRITRLQELRTTYQKLFTKDHSRKTLEILIDYLIGSPITSISQAQESLAVGSFNKVQRNIKKLEALGILHEVTGNKRNRIYHAREILKVLEERFH